MENALEVKDLGKKYLGFELKNINFILPKGTIMGMIGENGAGKSTTIKCMLDIIQKDSGEVKIFNKVCKLEDASIKEEVGVVLDDSFLSEYLRPKDIHYIMKNMYRNWDEKLFFNYIEQFKLPKNQIIKEYSSGMKMKLKIATALSHHPKLLILDEPTSGLDPIARNDVLDIFQEFVQDEEKSILISSHITSDLEHIADYITFIHQGSIVFNKSREELLEQYGIAKCTREEFEQLSLKDYIAYKKNKYDYEVLVENKKEFRKKYTVEIIDKPSIEEIMLIMIKGGNVSEKN